MFKRWYESKFGKSGDDENKDRYEPTVGELMDAQIWGTENMHPDRKSIMDAAIAQFNTTSNRYEQMFKMNLTGNIPNFIREWSEGFSPRKEDGYEIMMKEGEVVRVDLLCPLGSEHWNVSVVAEDEVDEWLEDQKSPRPLRVALIGGPPARVFEEEGWPGCERIEVEIPEWDGYYDGWYRVFAWNSEVKLVCRRNNRRVTALPGRRTYIQWRIFKDSMLRWSPLIAVLFGAATFLVALATLCVAVSNAGP